MDTRNLEALYPLSPLQQGMLFHGLDAPEEGLYVVQWRARLDGALTPAVFREAWQRLLDRHAALRVAILSQGVDEPLQVVHRRVELPWRELDRRHLSPAGQEREVAALARQERDYGFDFARAPLMRLALIRTADEAHELVWTFHHLLVDGWSFSVLLSELLVLHEALLERREPHLPEPPRYRDYVAWLGRQDLGAAEVYWRQALDGFREPLPLPRGFPGREAEPEQGPLDVRLPAPLAAGLEQAARHHRLTPNTLMLGALALLLGRATGRDDLVLGAVVSGRPPSLPRMEAMVGLFVNTLPVRVRLAPAATAGDWLRELQAQQAESRRFEHCPLSRIQRWSEVPPGQPLFEVLFAFESFPQAAAPEASGNGGGRQLRLETRHYAERLNYPLSLAVDPGSMGLRLLHDGKRIDRATARRLLSQYEHLLAGLAADLDRPLREISWLSPAERHQLVVEWNDSASAFPAGATIPEAFRRQVERDPNAEAVAFADGRWTYRELERRAAGLAARLRAAGAGAETLVGVCTERSASSIAGVLAILMAGGAYVPLDPGNPQDRLAFMVRDAGLRVILTQRPLAARLEGLGADLILLDELNELDEPAEAMGPAAGGPAGADALAYVIYTSGSTGTPKGVAIPHRGVLRLVLETDCARHEPGDRVAHVSSSSFDAATLEIWGALLNGAALVGLSPSDVLTPHLLARRLREERISVLSQPTALFNQVARAEPTAYAGIRQLFFGGETVDPQWPRQVARRGGPERLIHIYGPTENTTLTTWHRVREVPEEAATVSIGRPISNSRVLLLDRELEPVPIGVAGEMYLGGDGLARGYLGRPELTAERFVPDPWGGRPGARLYKTGDLARYGPDGGMEFVGRLDHQVKLRGFRIELEEVEAALREQPAVEQCAAMIREDARGDRRLVAYVVGGREPLPGAGELRAFLKRRLPDYMIPSALVPLEALPINAVGKVDRAALPAPEQLRPEGETPYAAPRTPLETELAGVWARVLRLDRVGVDDNFFDLGGDSILAIQIVARAGEAGLRITSKQLFEHQTVAELARVAGDGAARRVGPAAESAGTGPVPLTPVQRSFFEGDPVDPHHFNQAVLLRTASGLPARHVAAALRAILSAHEALRYRFTRTAGGGWEQRGGPAEGPVPFSVVDLSDVAGERRTAALETACAALQASLDLAHGPLLRAALFQHGREREGRLLIAVHHLVVDTVSWGILLHDLETACAQLGRGDAVRLPAPSTSFAHWARRLAEHARSQALRRELDVWLAGPWHRVRPLPTDFPDAGGGFGTAGSTRAVIRSLEADETRELLQKTPAAFGVRIQEVLLAALTRAVASWNGGPVLVDLEGHGRAELFDDVDLSRTVGWFTTVYPVLLDPSPDDGEEAVLRAVQQGLGRLPFDGIGYGLLRYLSGDPEAAGRLRALPPAEIAFNYLGRSGEAPDGGLLGPAPESPGPDGSPQAPRRHLLEVIAEVRDGRLTVHWGYSDRRHRAATLERLADGFLAALRSLVALGIEAGDPPPADAGLEQQLDSLLAEVSFGHE